MIDQIKKAAVSRCISMGYPFALVARPSCADYDFFAPEPGSYSHTEVYKDDDWQGLVIRQFESSPTDIPVSISRDLTADQILSMPDDAFPPHALREIVREKSTLHDEYINGVNALIEILKRSGGKTVISRVVVLETDKGFFDVVDRYFSIFGHTMRFIYYTPVTGLWIGATPEVVLTHTNDSSHYNTMSLAGTRPIDASSPWDSKNLREHKFVTDYLMDKLRAAGLKPEITDSRPLDFGHVQHLCDRIEAVGRTDYWNLLDSLSPTPALCGYPKDEAYQQILQTENHKRGCYGGWIAIKTDSRTDAYVNLRSASVSQISDDSWLYTIYVGGGITSDSDAEDEWQETEAKAVLAKIISTK